MAARARSVDKALVPELRLLGDDGMPKKTFAPGESLRLHLRGTRPSALHVITVSEQADKPLFKDQLVSNSRGEIEPTVIWPLVGLEDPTSAERVPVEEAIARWHGKQLTVAVATGGRAISKQVIAIDRALSGPLVISTDAKGVLLGGFEVGEHDARVSIYNPPQWERARIHGAAPTPVARWRSHSSGPPRQGPVLC